MSNFIKKLYPLPYIYRGKMKLKLKNDDFTIISSNCIGGIIYHLLGKQFLSPTINMRISSNDYIRMLNDLKYYVKQDFIEIEQDPKRGYPLGLLGDIPVHLNHYKSIEEANLKWALRRNRINWDNLYVLGNDLDGVSEQQLSSLVNYPCQNMVFFTHKHYPNLSFTQYIGDEKRLKKILGFSKVSGLYNFEHWFDYSDFLNKNVND